MVAKMANPNRTAQYVTNHLTTFIVRLPREAVLSPTSNVVGINPKGTTENNNQNPNEE